MSDPQPGEGPTLGVDYDIIAVSQTDGHMGVAVGVQPLVVHGPAQCAGSRCAIHNPSPHHMTAWPQHWRADRRMMERICPHGVGHPDPDSRYFDDAHGCDGCCTPTAKDQ